MMRSKRNCHFNRFENNPFLGEKFRIFLASQPGGNDVQAEDVDSVEKYLAPNIKRARASQSQIIEEVREWIPGPSTYDKKDQGAAMEENWKRLQGTHNGILNYSKWIVDLRQRLQKLDRNDPDWKEKIRNVHAGLDTLYQFQEADVSPIVSMPGMVISADTVTQVRSQNLDEFQSAKDEVLRVLGDVQVGLKNAEKESEILIKKQMKLDFEARLKWLKEAWTKNPPAHLKDKKKQIKEWTDKIDTIIEALRKTPEEYEGNFKSYQAIWRDLDYIESSYTGHQADQDYIAKKYMSEEEKGARVPLSFESLEEKANRLKELREKVVKEQAAKYETALQSTISRVQDFRARVAELPTEDESQENDKKEKLKDIDKQLDMLRKSVNLEKTSHDALFSERNLYAEEKEETPDVIKGLTLKKGLIHQIEQIKNSQDLSIAEEEALLVYLDQALNRFEKLLQADNFGPLAAINESITKSISIMEEPQAPGGQWSWNLISITDFGQAFKIISEWTTRKLDRNSKNRMGKAGTQVLKFLNKAPWPVAFLRTLSNDFDRVRESSELDEVNQYKTAYGNKDLFQVESIALSTHNQDEFKACLQLLAAGGRIRWDNVPLLMQLNKFQSTVHFSSNLADHLGNISQFYEKLAKAMGEMWDYDTFAGLRTQNDSAYNTTKGTFEQACAGWAQQEGGLPRVAESYLKDFKKAKATGRNPNFNPIAYEKIIDYGIDKGLMTHEDALYYLIQGIAWGILAFDRGANLNTAYSNSMPSLEWFSSPTESSKKPELKHVEKLAALDKLAFTHYFHKKIMNLPRVFQRANKALSQGLRLDHDALTSTLAYINVEPTRTMLRVQGDGFKLPSTGLHNWSVSEMHYLDQFAFDADSLFDDTRGLKERIGRFVGTVVMKRGILDNRIFIEDKSYFRYNSDDYESRPRSNGAYKDLFGREELETVKQYNKQIQTYLLILDEDFFGFLQDKNQTNDKVPELLRKLTARYGVKDHRDLFGGNEVKTVDQLHQYTSDFMAFLIDREKQFGKIHAMVNKIREDQKPAHEKLKRHLIQQRAAQASGTPMMEMRNIREQNYANFETSSGLGLGSGFGQDDT